jgi:hypothetical protein
VLIAAGHDLNMLLDRYSWEEIGLMAEMVLRDRYGTIESLLSPLLGMSGAEYKPASVESKTGKRARKKDPRSHKNADYDTDADKERALMGSLSRMGLRVKTVQASGESGDAG